VAHLREGMPGYRFRLPLEVHPVSAGVKGGLVGGLLMILPALAWGVLSQHGIWYPVNLLSGMVVPADPTLSPDELVQKMEQFSFPLLLVAVFIHATTSLVLGLMYGVLLPTLPDIPASLVWGALLAPILWTAVSYLLMGVVNPALQQGVSWPWFILSQFVFGVVMSVAVIGQAGRFPPGVAGIFGGLLGGALMSRPALLWGVGARPGGRHPVHLPG